jgi:hypothetical protein
MIVDQEHGRPVGGGGFGTGTQKNNNVDLRQSILDRMKEML